ncbi:hypothetical protein BU25DRAFT_424760 [Macroventuria anomochaeta]|uniref:Uncharacterized protein n=1 Tax=Macroventuria anomochaeta TaxID=301207 RepID=A0ACB6RNI1_9PLEO|nr:uncharacterized protein BU25DRAFT_424760 [Macroventuria anomochaeta]KAF2623505.1 hypothetical protein BU25DRAFT_424760 [Macroventuria anomochaeta]
MASSGAGSAASTAPKPPQKIFSANIARIMAAQKANNGAASASQAASSMLPQPLYPLLVTQCSLSDTKPATTCASKDQRWWSALTDDVLQIDLKWQDIRLKHHLDNGGHYNVEEGDYTELQMLVCSYFTQHRKNGCFDANNFMNTPAVMEYL